MEERNDCVLLKRKEYDDLLNKTQGDSLHITYDYNLYREYRNKLMYSDDYYIKGIHYAHFGETINLEGQLRSQILRIVDKFSESFNKEMDRFKERIKEDWDENESKKLKNRIIIALTKSSRRQRRRFLKGVISLDELIEQYESTLEEE